MVKKKVKLTNGEEQELEVPEHLPFTVGKKARRKLQAHLEADQNKKGKIRIDNVMEKLDDVAELILDHILEGTEVTLDQLSYESAADIVSGYQEELWQSVVGELRPKSKG